MLFFIMFFLVGGIFSPPFLLVLTSLSQTFLSGVSMGHVFPSLWWVSLSQEPHDSGGSSLFRFLMWHLKPPRTGPTASSAFISPALLQAAQACHWPLFPAFSCLQAFVLCSHDCFAVDSFSHSFLPSRVYIYSPWSKPFLENLSA